MTEVKELNLTEILTALQDFMTSDGSISNEQREFYSIFRQHLNEHEVAERIGISVKTLQRMRHEMLGIPFKKIGRRVIYSEIEVARYLDSHSVSLNP